MIKHKALLILPLVCLNLSSCFLFHSDPCKNAPKENVEIAPEDISLYAYIENSGSMDGYVKGVTLFKTDLYSLITDSHINQRTLNYINDSIYTIKAGPRDFILNLSPAAFKAQGGKRAFSDIAEVIEKALNNSKKGVMLLASDFIFSPPQNSDVPTYLNMQKQDICNSLTQKLKGDPYFAVVVLQGISAYDGYYWNVRNDASAFHGERPYYVLIAGKRSEVATLLHSSEKNGTTHFTQSYTEMGCTAVAFEVENQKSAKDGTFHLCKKGEKHHIMRCKANKRTETFRFSVKADFSNLALTDAFLKDTRNYVTNNSAYRVTAVTPCDKESKSYLLTIEATDSKHLTAMPLEVKLQKTFPSWISQSNDASGIQPLAGKTFGLSFMAEGIKKAFESTGDCYASLKIYIEN